ncbi:MAG: hypothetical protein ACMXYG_02805 [Candidatus Woesearchaeota archaeon]
MVSITLSVPTEVKQKMEKYSEINWSGFVRKQIIDKVEKLSLKERILAQAKEDEIENQKIVNMIKESRKGRYEILKQKGLLE